MNIRHIILCTSGIDLFQPLLQELKFVYLVSWECEENAQARRETFYAFWLCFSKICALQSPRCLLPYPTYLPLQKTAFT